VSSSDTQDPLRLYTDLIERIRKAPDFYDRSEKIAFRLVGAHVGEQNATIEVFVSGRIDGVIRQGIPGLLGPTLIDVSFALQRALSDSYWGDVLGAVKNTQANSLLLVTSGSPSADRLKAVQNKDKRFLPKIQVSFWGPAELAPLLEKYPEVVSDLAPELQKRAVASVVASAAAASEDWIPKRARLIEQIRSEYQRDNLALFLGAGVSMPCGVPSWQNLIFELAVSMVKRHLPTEGGMSGEEQRAIANGMVELQASSPLLEATYIQEGLAQDFEKNIRELLYRDVTAQKVLLPKISGG